MKSNNKMVGSNQPQGLIENQKIYKSWATYILKFIQAYNNSGVQIW